MVQPVDALPAPTVLVVDEGPLVRTAIASEVARLGHAVLQAPDTAAAWSLLAERRVEVVLVDWPIPGAPALALLAHIRMRERDEGHPYTAVFALVPGGAAATTSRALAAGADGVLVKPVEPVELAGALPVAIRLARLESDVAERDERLRRQEELLREEVRRDPVTRLGNRLRLDEDLRRLRGQVRRYGHRVTAVMVAVDHLRRYRMAAGEDAADELLRQVGRAVRDCLRDADSAYRIAGDQVLLLLPEQGEDGGVVVAERCRVAVARLGVPHPRSDAGPTVTVSAGVAELAGDAPDDLDEWLRRAAQALDAAKASGRNAVARGTSTVVAEPDEGRTR